MNNILPFPNSSIKEYRKKCLFKTRKVHVQDEDGRKRDYACIVLYEKEADIPLVYTGLERYLYHLSKHAVLSEKTIFDRAYAVCHFLNHILWETDLNAIHECSINELHDAINSMTKEDGTEYARSTWEKYKNSIIDFLELYYESNKHNLLFKYIDTDIKMTTVIWSSGHHVRYRLKEYASMYCSPPKVVHKKNRILVDGYLELLLYEAKKYDPELALGIALGAYAGLREGEVVNVSCGRIKRFREKYGKWSEIEIDLSSEGPHFHNWKGKTNPGSIKKYRKQRVYFDFVLEVNELYEAHIARREMRDMDTSPDAPLFVNKWGHPMTVQTYSNRLKKLFYEKFLPHLSVSCERQGTYIDNAAFIDAYLKEYPGAHMFRHWFTMYLLTKAKLRSGEIMKWRGDSSQESMNDYIHENGDLIEIYRESSYAFQRMILEDILRC